jgi:hypothetical protein
MKRVIVAVWVLAGLVAAAIWAGDDLADNEIEKIEGRG